MKNTKEKVLYDKSVAKSYRNEICSYKNSEFFKILLVGSPLQLGKGSCWEANTLSSTEAEYRGVVNATTQCLWLQGLLGECGFELEYSTTIYCDNHSTIRIYKDPV